MSDEVIDFYSGYDEQSRLKFEFSLERLRSQELISRALTGKNLRILDVGGAAGAYSFWLASLGHRVSLIDLTPKHIEQAKESNRVALKRLDFISQGNAAKLDFEDSAFDVVLLMGPLYHIQDKLLRIQAIREALRVLKDGGRLVFACISRFASCVDGFQFGLVNDRQFRAILDQDLRTGDHVNTTGNPQYFTNAHLHLPEEIEEEVKLGGFSECCLYAVEGVGSIIPNIEEKMKDGEFRDYLMKKVAETEEERSIIGMSSHFIGIAARGGTSWS